MGPQKNVEEFRWVEPRNRDFGALSAIQLYGETLHIAEQNGFVTAELLISPEEGLLGRRAGRLFHRRERSDPNASVDELVLNPTRTNIEGLLSILHRFGWLNPDQSKLRFLLTSEGRKAAQLFQSDDHQFRRLVARELHQYFQIPGWFIDRLYRLNPTGSGQVILPAPPKYSDGSGVTHSISTGFRGIPLRLPWKEAEWLPSLERIVLNAASLARNTIPGSFPVADEEWLREVQSVWSRLGLGKPPKKLSSENAVDDATFGVRQRLFHCMREAAINLLFGPVAPGTPIPDFISLKHPIPYRAFTVWCPRLGELEFIFYTDFHPRIHGRLLVPCAAFRQSASQGFESIDTIRDPEDRILYLHQPDWNSIAPRFLHALEVTYQEESQRAGSIYVSLLVLRDEICRRLQISALRFDFLLLHAYESSIRSVRGLGRSISISLETDIRPDQRGAVGQNQRPIYINGIPHSLIALGTRKLDNYESAPSKTYTPP